MTDSQRRIIVPNLFIQSYRASENNKILAIDIDDVLAATKHHLVDSGFLIKSQRLRIGLAITLIAEISERHAWNPKLNDC